MSDELKPCPFCGDEAEHIHVFAHEEIVRCTNECCFVRPSVTCELPEECFELWNKRAAPAIPGGFALVVPIRPNQDMCYAGQIKAREWPKFPLRIAPIYQAMLAAAPKVGD